MISCVINGQPNKPFAYANVILGETPRTFIFLEFNFNRKYGDNMIYYEQVEHDEMYFEISGCSLLLTKLEPEHIYAIGQHINEINPTLQYDNQLATVEELLREIEIAIEKADKQVLDFNSKHNQINDKNKDKNDE